MPTVKKQVKFSGVGIHSGLPVNMVIKPSKKIGIFFHRTDIAGDDILARLDKVGDTKMHISIPLNIWWRRYLWPG